MDKLGLAFLLLAAVGVVTLLPSSTLEESRAAPPSLASRACLLGDVTGDGVPDIGALIRRELFDPVRAALIDGATGNLVWETSSYETENEKLLCLGAKHLGVIDQRAHQLTIVPANSPDDAIQRSLSDELISFGFDDTCLKLDTKDERSIGVALDDGSEITCAAEARLRPAADEENALGFRQGVIATMPPFEVRSERLRFALRTRTPGIPFLEVAAHPLRGRRARWTQRLSYVPVGGESTGYLAAATAPGVVVVLGNPREDRNEVVAIALDERRGAERWKVSLPSAPVARIGGLFFNGRYIIIALDQSLTALDPATGHIAWKLA